MFHFLVLKRIANQRKRLYRLYLNPELLDSLMNRSLYRLAEQHITVKRIIQQRGRHTRIGIPFGEIKHPVIDQRHADNRMVILLREQATDGIGDAPDNIPLVVQHREPHLLAKSPLQHHETNLFINNHQHTDNHAQIPIKQARPPHVLHRFGNNAVQNNRKQMESV